jgi:hypothetical protein
MMSGRKPSHPHVPQGEEGQLNKGPHVCQWAQAKGWHLVKTRDYVADGGNGISVYHRHY